MTSRRGARTREDDGDVAGTAPESVIKSIVVITTDVAAAQLKMGIVYRFIIIRRPPATPSTSTEFTILDDRR